MAAEVDPAAYLTMYGYLDPVVPRNPSASYLTAHAHGDGDGGAAGEMRNAIEEFQAVAGIAVTGELDDATREAIQ